MTAGAVFVQMRLQIIERQVPADVAIKFAIDVAAGVADLCTPDLLARLDIAGKYRNSVRTHHRSMNAVSRTRIAVKYRVRIADEIFDPRVF